MKNFPKAFNLKQVSDIATELGFNTPMLKRTEQENNKYFETFELEVLEKQLPQGNARLEIVSYKGKEIVAMAFAAGREMILEPNQIEVFKNQLK